MVKRKARKKEYDIEISPFYTEASKVRANLTELSKSTEKDVVLARKRYYKQEEYVKFIVNKEFDITSYYKLSKIADTILQYILYNCLEYNDPVFRLKAKDIAIILDTDTSFIYRGIRELIDSKYIAKTSTKETYWINHNLYYKGNFMIDRHLKTK